MEAKNFENEGKEPFFNRLIYQFAFFILGILLFLIGPIRKVNKRAIPRKGGLIILANHESVIDPVVLQLGCSRRVYFMAKKELFKISFLKMFLRIARAFPVEQKVADRHAIKQAISLLKQGNVVGIFPEGEMSESGELLPILPGAALIAMLADVPLICSGLKNTAKIIPYHSMIPRPSFSKIIIKWGEPKKFPKETPLIEITSWIESELQALKR